MADSFNIKYIDIKCNEEMEMPLEKMVKILLALEIDISFHIETLKAQAIIIRTNLLRTSKFLGGKGDISLDIKPLESYKNIWKEDYNKNINKIHEAIEKTKGIVILFENKPIDAKYHICCGGSTENAENVVDNPIRYLRRVLCDYCKDSPYWENEQNFTVEELGERLETRFPKIDGNTDTEMLGFIDNIEKDEQGRVISLKIGDRYYKSSELMENLDLHSTRFSVYPIDIKFISRGKGHGLGFCQQGAEKMAQQGAKFEELLKYYYTGIEIKEFPLPCIKKPLHGKIIVIDPGHGGEDKGYEGDYLGLEEKIITKELALMLKAKLEHKGATVHLTREKDENILIAKRIEKANKTQPDFFISIHLDYYPNSNMKGCEIFHFREDYEAKKLGDLILEKLKENLVPTRGTKEGNFYVFRGIKASSLLIEIGYLSNIEEEIRFSQEEYLISIVNGIKNGILEYFEN